MVPGFEPVTRQHSYRLERPMTLNLGAKSPSLLWRGSLERMVPAHVSSAPLDHGSKLEGQPAGWRGWSVAGILYSRLRVRPWLKSVDFHDAENRQRPCRLIIWHVKEP
ncbi:hypothetical protein TNCV_2705351 [Trichonephila clavipes]|nr:hypothetical protein TNCV_2705351 [Trichonephila clavipes]